MSGRGGSTELSVDEAFARVARAVGGEAHSGFGFAPRVQKQTGDWILTLKHVATDLGRVTRLRAPYRNPESFSFAVRHERFLDDVLESLGFLQDIIIGDPELDQRFVFKGTSRARVRALFTEPRVREILRKQPKLDLRVSRITAPGPPFPKGVRELHFLERSTIVDVPRLVSLFELFELLLPRLCPDSQGYEGNLERLVDRLLGPGQRVNDTLGNAVLWDGYIPRRDAAERLGRLGDPRAVGPLVSVLDDEDDELVARAAAALAELGAEEAEAPLVRLLGQRRREVEGVPMSERAAEGLRRLGREDLVRAFEAALEGEPSTVEEMGHRDEVVAALLEILDSAEFVVAAHAARALGALGAREAVPLLRSKSRGWGMKTTLTEACEEALEEIEARAGLPRPARPASPDSEATLPRPARDDPPSADTLPRPVDGEAEAT